MVLEILSHIIRVLMTVTLIVLSITTIVGCVVVSTKYNLLPRAIIGLKLLKRKDYKKIQKINNKYLTQEECKNVMYLLLMQKDVDLKQSPEYHEITLRYSRKMQSLTEQEDYFNGKNEKPSDKLLKETGFNIIEKKVNKYYSEFIYDVEKLRDSLDSEIIEEALRVTEEFEAMNDEEVIPKKEEPKLDTLEQFDNVFSGPHYKPDYSLPEYEEPEELKVRIK